MNFKTGMVLYALMILTSFGTAASAQTASSIKSRNFVQEVSIVNQFEILSSALAMKKAITPEVRGFAQMMVADHSEIGDKLQATIDSSRSDLVPADKLNMKHQKILDGLKSSFSPKFDSLYIQAQIDAHAESVSLFKDYIQYGDDAQLIKFASETLPALEENQLKAHSLSPMNLSAGAY